MRTIARVAVAAAGVVTAGLLAGCGIADDSVRPGVAAEVGDTTIKVADVEEGAEDRCEMLDQRSEGAPDSQPISGARVRDAVLHGEVLRVVADELAEEYDVESSQLYDDVLAEIRRQLESIDPDLLDRIEASLASRAYFDDVLIQVGREDLGITESEDPQGQLSYGRGLEIAEAWQDEHQIEINPRYAKPVIDAQVGVRATRDDLTIAVSQYAKTALGAADDPQGQDPAYAATLPDSQRCG